MIEVKKTFPEQKTPEKIQAVAEKILREKAFGFLKMPSRSEAWENSQARAGQIKERFERTFVIGIGGSSLGAKALAGTFEDPHHPVIFLESPDTIYLRRILQTVPRWEKAHFIFISKSGGTLETLSVLEYLHGLLDVKGLSLPEQSTVISGVNNSALFNWAKENGIFHLEVPEDVGGRFSVLTPVGLLPAALLGVQLGQLRKGAEWVFDRASLVANLSALGLASFDRQEWISQIWIYSQSCQELGRWWQQLWSESLGKAKDRNGKQAPRVSTPMVCVGPQDQHSLLQQLQEGFKDKWILLLEDKSNTGADLKINELHLKGLSFSSRVSLGDVLKAEMNGLVGALDMSRISHSVIEFSSQDPQCWGAFFMLWEAVIATMAEMLDIDAFDQPGVELGKRLAKQYLQQ